MRFRRFSNREMHSHFLVMLQWTLVVIIVAFGLDFPLVVTSAFAQGGFKVMSLSSLLIPLLTIVLSATFYGRRNEGPVERCIFVLSLLTIVSSFVNILSYFVNNSLLIMIGAEAATWILFNVTFSASVYKVLLANLRSVHKRPVTIEQNAQVAGRKL